MIVLVFGNPDWPQDSLPLRILPQLKEKFPRLDFQIKDPNEELDLPDGAAVIDTVQGIGQVRIFSDLAELAGVPRVSLHDFGVLSHLQYLKKLGRIRKINIIGVPPTFSEEEAFNGVSAILSNQL